MISIRRKSFLQDHIHLKYKQSSAYHVKQMKRFSMKRITQLTEKTSAQDSDLSF